MALIPIIPAMTGNNTPSPFVTSASTIRNTSYDAFTAFNRNAVTNWSTPVGTLTGWIAIDMGTAKRAATYSITAINLSSATTRSPKNWTLEGSNNGTDWQVLDTQTNITFAISEVKSFTVTNPGSYRHYRLNITANNGDVNYLSIDEIQYYEDSTFVEGPTQPKRRAVVFI